MADGVGAKKAERRLSFSQHFKKYANFKDQFQGQAVTGHLPRPEGRLMETVLDIPTEAALREALEKFAPKMVRKFDGERVAEVVGGIVEEVETDAEKERRKKALIAQRNAMEKLIRGGDEFNLRDMAALANEKPFDKLIRQGKVMGGASKKHQLMEARDLLMLKHGENDLSNRVQALQRGIAQLIRELQHNDEEEEEEGEEEIWPSIKTMFEELQTGERCLKTRWFVVDKFTTTEKKLILESSKAEVLLRMGNSVLVGSHRQQKNRQLSAHLCLPSVLCVPNEPWQIAATRALQVNILDSLGLRKEAVCLLENTYKLMDVEQMKKYPGILTVNRLHYVEAVLMVTQEQQNVLHHMNMTNAQIGKSKIVDPDAPQVVTADGTGLQAALNKAQKEDARNMKRKGSALMMEHLNVKLKVKGSKEDAAAVGEDDEEEVVPDSPSSSEYSDSDEEKEPEEDERPIAPADLEFTLMFAAGDMVALEGGADQAQQGQQGVMPPQPPPTPQMSDGGMISALPAKADSADKKHKNFWRWFTPHEYSMIQCKSVDHPCWRYNDHAIGLFNPAARVFFDGARGRPLHEEQLESCDRKATEVLRKLLDEQEHLRKVKRVWKDRRKRKGLGQVTVQSSDLTDCDESGYDTEDEDEEEEEEAEEAEPAGDGEGETAWWAKGSGSDSDSSDGDMGFGDMGGFAAEPNWMSGNEEEGGVPNTRVKRPPKKVLALRKNIEKLKTQLHTVRSAYSAVRTMIQEKTQLLQELFAGCDAVYYHVLHELKSPNLDGVDPAGDGGRGENETFETYEDVREYLHVKSTMQSLLVRCVDATTGVCSPPNIVLLGPRPMIARQRNLQASLQPLFTQDRCYITQLVGDAVFTGGYAAPGGDEESSDEEGGPAVDGEGDGGALELDYDPPLTQRDWKRANIQVGALRFKLEGACWGKAEVAGMPAIQLCSLEQLFAHSAIYGDIHPLEMYDPQLEAQRMWQHRKFREGKVARESHYRDAMEASVKQQKLKGEEENREKPETASQRPGTADHEETPVETRDDITSQRQIVVGEVSLVLEELMTTILRRSTMHSAVRAPATTEERSLLQDYGDVKATIEMAVIDGEEAADQDTTDATGNIFLSRPLMLTEKQDRHYLSALVRVLDEIDVDTWQPEGWSPLRGVTHGALHGRNVFVDATSTAWLAYHTLLNTGVEEADAGVDEEDEDIEGACMGPVLRDVAALEAAMLFLHTPMPVSVTQLNQMSADDMHQVLGMREDLAVSLVEYRDEVLLMKFAGQSMGEILDQVHSGFERYAASRLKKETRRQREERLHLQRPELKKAKKNEDLKRRLGGNGPASPKRGARSPQGVPGSPSRGASAAAAKPEDDDSEDEEDDDDFLDDDNWIGLGLDRPDLAVMSAYDLKKQWRRMTTQLQQFDSQCDLILEQACRVSQKLIYIGDLRQELQPVHEGDFKGAKELLLDDIEVFDIEDAEEDEVEKVKEWAIAESQGEEAAAVAKAMQEMERLEAAEAVEAARIAEEEARKNPVKAKPKKKEPDELVILYTPLLKTWQHATKLRNLIPQFLEARPTDSTVTSDADYHPIHLLLPLMLRALAIALTPCGDFGGTISSLQRRWALKSAVMCAKRLRTLVSAPVMVPERIPPVLMEGQVAVERFPNYQLVKRRPLTAYGRWQHVQFFKDGRWRDGLVSTKAVDSPRGLTTICHPSMRGKKPKPTKNNALAMLAGSNRKFSAAFTASGFTDNLDAVSSFLVPTFKYHRGQQLFIWRLGRWLPVRVLRGGIDNTNDHLCEGGGGMLVFSLNQFNHHLKRLLEKEATYNQTRPAVDEGQLVNVKLLLFRREGGTESLLEGKNMSQAIRTAQKKKRAKLKVERAKMHKKINEAAGLTVQRKRAQMQWGKLKQKHLHKSEAAQMAIKGGLFGVIEGEDPVERWVPGVIVNRERANAGVQFDVVVKLPPGIESVSTGEGEFGLHPDLVALHQRGNKMGAVTGGRLDQLNAHMDYLNNQFEKAYGLKQMAREGAEEGGEEDDEDEDEEDACTIEIHRRVPGDCCSPMIHQNDEVESSYLGGDLRTRGRVIKQGLAKDGTGSGYNVIFASSTETHIQQKQIFACYAQGIRVEVRADGESKWRKAVIESRKQGHEDIGGIKTNKLKDKIKMMSLGRSGKGNIAQVALLAAKRLDKHKNVAYTVYYEDTGESEGNIGPHRLRPAVRRFSGVEGRYHGGPLWRKGRITSGEMKWVYQVAKAGIRAGNTDENQIGRLENRDVEVKLRGGLEWATAKVKNLNKDRSYSVDFAAGLYQRDVPVGFTTLEEPFNNSIDSGGMPIARVQIKQPPKAKKNNGKRRKSRSQSKANVNAPKPKIVKVEGRQVELDVAVLLPNFVFGAPMDECVIERIHADGSFDVWVLPPLNKRPMVKERVWSEEETVTLSPEQLAKRLEEDKQQRRAQEMANLKKLGQKLTKVPASMIELGEGTVVELELRGDKGTPKEQELGPAGKWLHGVRVLKGFQNGDYMVFVPLSGKRKEPQPVVDGGEAEEHMVAPGVRLQVKRWQVWPALPNGARVLFDFTKGVGGPFDATPLRLQGQVTAKKSGWPHASYNIVCDKFSEKKVDKEWIYTQLPDGSTMDVRYLKEDRWAHAQITSRVGSGEYSVRFSEDGRSVYSIKRDQMAWGKGSAIKLRQNTPGSKGHKPSTKWEVASIKMAVQKWKFNVTYTEEGVARADIFPAVAVVGSTTRTLCTIHDDQNEHAVHPSATKKGKHAKHEHENTPSKSSSKISAIAPPGGRKVWRTARLIQDRHNGTYDVEYVQPHVPKGWQKAMYATGTTAYLKRRKRTDAGTTTVMMRGKITGVHVTGERGMSKSKKGKPSKDKHLTAKHVRVRAEKGLQVEVDLGTDR
jgi:hypothetical protein